VFDVFTKRVLVEKHISGIVCENPRGTAAPPLCQRPLAQRECRLSRRVVYIEIKKILKNKWLGRCMIA